MNIVIYSSSLKLGNKFLSKLIGELTEEANHYDVRRQENQAHVFFYNGDEPVAYHYYVITSGNQLQGIIWDRLYADNEILKQHAQNSVLPLARSNESQMNCFHSRDLS